MALSSHLRELRRRLFRAAIALAAGAVVAWFLAGPVLDAMRRPVTGVAADGRLAVLNYDSVTGAFDLRIHLTLVIAIVISSPVWLYQLWAFFVPAMTRREKAYGFGFFFSAVPLFLAGSATGWFLVPHVISLMTGFAAPQDATILQAKTYVEFVMTFVLAVGVAFVLPVFLVLLNFVGVLSARSIIASWRWALVGITLFTAIATPAADVLSMFLVAIPMAALYFAAYGVAAVHDRRALAAGRLIVAELEG